MRNLIKNKKKQEIIGLIAAFILIAAGIIIMFLSLNQYRGSIEDKRYHDLEDASRSVDYNMNVAMTRFENQMDYLIHSRRFSGILMEEAGLGSSADSQGILRDDDTFEDTVQKSSFGNLSTFEVMIATDSEGKTIASSSDDRAYSIGSHIRDNIYQCSDSAGNEYLAYRHSIENGIYCYGVQEIDEMFMQAMQSAGAVNDIVLLLEKPTDSVFFKDGSAVRNLSAGDISEQSGIDTFQVQTLIESNSSGRKEIAEYTSKGEKTARSNIMNMVAIPATDTENAIFSIAVAADYSGMSYMLRSTATRLMICFLLVIVGLLLLTLILIYNSREKRLADHQLEVLREKNRQMEELNRTTEEIAHRQRLETIGTMTSSIAHEFNNLLTPIMGYSLMTLESLTEEQESIYDDVLEIYNASVRAKDIISRLSDLSRKNTEKVFVPMDPDSLAEKVVNVAAPALPKQVDIERNYSCLGHKIMGNETQISQLLLNLIINAFHAIGEQKGVVKISTECRDGFVIFQVEDDGPGISEELQSKIFDPFFTTKESGEGTGLGLAIAMQAAEDHGGRIELDSEAGRGSCFRVFIPEFGTDAEDELNIN